MSDQGSEFTNNEKLFEMSGTDHRVSSAYHSQTNGLERFNQTIQQALLKFAVGDCDLLLDSILFAYRTSKHDSTKYTPFFLMCNREAKLPIDMEITKESHPKGSNGRAMK